MELGTALLPLTVETKERLPKLLKVGGWPTRLPPLAISPHFSHQMSSLSVAPEACNALLMRVSGQSQGTGDKA